MHASVTWTEASWLTRSGQSRPSSSVALAASNRGAALDQCSGASPVDRCKFSMVGERRYSGTTAT